MTFDILVLKCIPFSSWVGTLLLTKLRDACQIIILMAEMAVILCGLATSNEGDACGLIYCFTVGTNSK